MRTKSANERAPIFLITLPRCTLAVISLTPSSPATCLFIRPVVTKLSTSCSRGVNASKRARVCENRTFPDATITITLERELNGIEKILIAEWFG